MGAKVLRFHPENVTEGQPGRIVFSAQVGKPLRVELPPPWPTYVPPRPPSLYRRLLALLTACAAALLLALPAHAIEQEWTIAPDASYPWACDFGTAISEVTGTWTHLRGDTEGSTCTGLVSGLQVSSGDNHQAIWIWEPSALDATKQHVCWVHLIATDTGGFTYTCDGKITVKSGKPST